MGHIAGIVYIVLMILATLLVLWRVLSGIISSLSFYARHREKKEPKPHSFLKRWKDFIDAKME